LAPPVYRNKGLHCLLLQVGATRLAGQPMPRRRRLAVFAPKTAGTTMSLFYSAAAAPWKRKWGKGVVGGGGGGGVVFSWRGAEITTAAE